MSQFFPNLTGKVELKHEPWRDEAQHWLIARDLSPLGMIYEMRYDGHLCLWNMLLAIFAKTGFPYITLNLISLSVMSLAGALFLFRSPFPLWMKALIIFSPVFTYFYPVISRQYCLIAPLLMFLAILYPQRMKKPLLYGLLIALLVQTHIIMLGMAAVLSVLWLIEALQQYHQEQDRRQLRAQALGLCLPLLSLIFLIIQLYAVPVSSTWFLNRRNDTSNLAAAFWAALTESISALYGNNPASSWLILAWFMILAALGLRAHQNGLGRMLIIGGVSILCETLIFAFVYDASTQRILTWVYILLFVFWNQWEQIRDGTLKSLSGALITLTALALLLNDSGEIVRDYSWPYSDSKRCAAYINENVPKDALILTNSDNIAAAVIPYLQGHKIWNPSIHASYSYVRWDTERMRFSSDTEIMDWLRSDFPDRDSFYLLYIDEWNEISNVDALIRSGTLEYKTALIPIIENERYQLYKIPLTK